MEAFERLNDEPIEVNYIIEAADNANEFEEIVSSLRSSLMELRIGSMTLSESMVTIGSSMNTPATSMELKRLDRTHCLSKSSTDTTFL